MPGLNTSPVAKLLVPLLVVGVILGGWTWINRYRESHVALPDELERHAAFIASLKDPVWLQ